MSEDNIPETGPVSVDDVLAAIQQQNVGRARSHFNDLMSNKVTDALNAEKVKIASHVYGNDFEDEINAAKPETEQPEEPEVTGEMDEIDVESELEDAFTPEEEEENA